MLSHKFMFNIMNMIHFTHFLQLFSVLPPTHSLSLSLINNSNVLVCFLFAWNDENKYKTDEKCIAKYAEGEWEDEMEVENFHTIK